VSKADQNLQEVETIMDNLDMSSFADGTRKKILMELFNLPDIDRNFVLSDEIAPSP
jgi:hypothetical protein